MTRSTLEELESCVKQKTLQEVNGDDIDQSYEEERNNFYEL